MPQLYTIMVYEVDPAFTAILDLTDSIARRRINGISV
jgi:hypothetical protein